MKCWVTTQRNRKENIGDTNNLGVARAAAVMSSAASLATRDSRDARARSEIRKQTSKRSNFY
eukprot:scaffold98989_cov30-Tisochrysis_lutea.AAC.1